MRGEASESGIPQAGAARWEQFPHDADVGIRGYGRSREQAFEQAALALFAVVTEPGRVAPEQTVEIDCSAPDDELLLVDWLNALIYEMATRKLCFGSAQVQIDGHKLRGRAVGEPLDIGKHEPAVEPKGATYTAARVGREGDLWVAQCVVDV